MNPVYEKLQKCYESYRAKIDFTPKVALVLIRTGRLCG